MKKRITDYRNRIDALLSTDDASVRWDEVLSEHLVQVGFFQHERLVHLIVTMTVALLAMLSMGVGLIGDYMPAFLLTVGFLILLVPYILHYYTLENEVQKMYDQYDRILEKCRRCTADGSEAKTEQETQNACQHIVL